MSKTKVFSIHVARDLPDEVYNDICEFALKETQRYVKFLDIDAHVHHYRPCLISVVFNDAYRNNLDFIISRSTGKAVSCDLYIAVHYSETERKYDPQPQYVTNTIGGGPASMVDFITSKIDKELKTNVAIDLDSPEGRYLRHDVYATKEIMNKTYGYYGSYICNHDELTIAAKEFFNGRFGTPVTPKKVIFNDPATIVYWSDGTKTVVKKQKGDAFKKETGLAMCYVKKFCGNNTSRGLNDILSLAGTRKKSKKKKGVK